MVGANFNIEIVVKFGNWLYLLIIFVCGLLLVCSVILTQKTSKKFNFYFILTLLFFNFALHFAKQFFPSYLADFPYSLKKSTAENICAWSVMFFPFIFLFGNKTFKDYMYYIGVISGIAVLIMPSDVLGKDLTVAQNLYEAIRFYMCHLLIVMPALLMVTCRFHTLNYHRMWKVALVFLAVLTFIFVNELCLMASGLVQSDWKSFFSRDWRNGAFIFGPASKLDYLFSWGYFLVPAFLKYYWPGTTELFFFPILWIVIPLFIVAYPVGILMSLPYEKQRLKVDFHQFKYYFTRHKYFDCGD